MCSSSTAATHASWALRVSVARRRRAYAEPCEVTPASRTHERIPGGRGTNRPCREQAGGRLGDVGAALCAVQRAELLTNWLSDPRVARTISDADVAPPIAEALETATWGLVVATALLVVASAIPAIASLTQLVAERRRVAEVIRIFTSCAGG